VSLAAESSSAGAVAPPLSVPAVPEAAVSPVSVLGAAPASPLWSLGAVVLPGSGVGVGVASASASAPLPPASTVSDGTYTPTGGPGTSS
jgi:hypothetical protein